MLARVKQWVVVFIAFVKLAFAWLVAFARHLGLDKAIVKACEMVAVALIVVGFLCAGSYYAGRNAQRHIVSASKLFEAAPASSHKEAVSASVKRKK